MSEVAVHCPHCGQAHVDRDPRASTEGSMADRDRPGRLKDVTREEAAALLAMSGAAGPSPSLFRDFLRPHTTLPAPLFLLDVLCVAATLPLLAGLLLARLFGRRRRPFGPSRDGKATYSGLWWEKVFIGAVGGGLLLAAAYLSSPELFSVALPIVLLAWLALSLRILLRTPRAGANLRKPPFE